MAARSKARKRALDVLFAAEARDVPALDLLAERMTDPEATPMGEFAADLVRGVNEHLTRIDDVIAQHSIDWTLERMPAVDRAILRIAVYELVYGDGVDAPVVIDEAVELAKSLSTDASPRFINGVLAQVLAIVPQLRA
jgi:transcription antitermination protein NusB